MTTDGLPPLPPGVLLVPGQPLHEEVVTWWRLNYSGVVERARAGAPVAVAATFRKARAEVEYARLHGTEPRRGVS